MRWNGFPPVLCGYVFRERPRAINWNCQSKWPYSKSNLHLSLILCCVCAGQKLSSNFDLGDEQGNYHLKNWTSLRYRQLIKEEFVCVWAQSIYIQIRADNNQIYSHEVTRWSTLFIGAINQQSKVKLYVPKINLSWRNWIKKIRCFNYMLESDHQIVTFENKWNACQSFIAFN